MSGIITAVGHYVPTKVVSNNDLSKLMDTSDEWITERTGIRERRFVEVGVPSSDLAVEAVKNLEDRYPGSLKGVDLIIAATLSPDLYFPGIGVLIQKKLSLPTIPALDIRAQCSGLVYGLSIADAYISSGQARKILLVCSEVQSPVLDLTTKGRDMAVLFGDGAGAVIVSASADAEKPSGANNIRGIIDSHLGSDGEGAEILCMKVPGTATPNFLRKEDLEADVIHPQMDGRTVFKNAVSRMCETAETLVKRNRILPSSIKLLLPHQANLRINEMVAQKLGLSESQTYNNISKYGNTTSATIPILLSEAIAEGRVGEGDLILTLAFGAGFTWGGNLIRL